LKLFQILNEETPSQITEQKIITTPNPPTPYDSVTNFSKVTVQSTVKVNSSNVRSKVNQTQSLQAKVAQTPSLRTKVTQIPNSLRTEVTQSPNTLRTKVTQSPTTLQTKVTQRPNTSQTKVTSTSTNFFVENRKTNRTQIEVEILKVTTPLPVDPDPLTKTPSKISLSNTEKSFGDKTGENQFTAKVI
jgi:hypothetical protein